MNEFLSSKTSDMTKSTPISQLPNNPVLSNMAANSFEGQQRQQAIQSFAMPQNTQSSNDTLDENEDIVKDTLQQLGGGMLPPSRPPPSQQQQPPPVMMQPPQQMQQEIPEFTKADPIEYYNRVPEGIAQQPGMFHESPANTYFQPSQPMPIETFNNEKNALSDLATLQGDIKNVVVVMVVYALVAAIPVEHLIYRYIALDKIPYSKIIIKAVLAGAAFFIISKIVNQVG
jgi:hypothetical protein